MVFQEIVVLSALELANFLVILTSGVDYFDLFQPIVLQLLAVQFHQWSWLAVTYLRFSFWIHNLFSAINFYNFKTQILASVQASPRK